MAETYIVAIQARILLLVTLGWLALGLVQGFDPMMVTWRAVAGGFAAMLVSGVLLRIALRSILGRLAALEAAEQEEAAEVDA